MYNKKIKKIVDNSELTLSEQSEKGFNYALWMIGRSQKTESEVRKKLREKKYQAEAIDAIIERLYQYKYLDDENYAILYAQDSYNFNNLGRQGIQRKMYAKGFSSDIIQEALDQVFNQDREIEEDRVREIAYQRVRGMKNLEPEKAYNRLCGFLSRKGFSPDLVFPIAREVVDSYFSSLE